MNSIKVAPSSQPFIVLRKEKHRSRFGELPVELVTNFVIPMLSSARQLACVYSPHELEEMRVEGKRVRARTHTEALSTLKLPYPEVIKVLSAHGWDKKHLVIDAYLSEREAREMLSLCPNITSLSVVGGVEAKTALDYLIMSICVQELKLEVGFEDDLFQTFIALLDRYQLVHLDLNRCGLTQNSLGMLVGALKLESLRSVHLASNNLGFHGVPLLIQAPFSADLQVLDMAANNIGDEGAKLLIDHCPKLRKLNLSHNELQNSAIEPIFLEHKLPLLEELNLSQNFLNDDAASFIAASETSLQLRALNLQNNHITNSGAEVLAASHKLTKLQNFDISCNRISLNVIGILCYNKNFPLMRTLSL